MFPGMRPTCTTGPAYPSIVPSQPLCSSLRPHARTPLHPTTHSTNPSALLHIPLQIHQTTSAACFRSSHCHSAPLAPLGPLNPRHANLFHHHHLQTSYPPPNALHSHLTSHYRSLSSAPTPPGSASALTHERATGKTDGATATQDSSVSKSGKPAVAEASAAAASTCPTNAHAPSEDADAGGSGSDDVESGDGANTGTADIAARIAASRARRATRLSYNCPACSISAATPANIARHMSRCCPDLVAQDAAAWDMLESLTRGNPSPQHDAAVGLLRAAGSREAELRRRVLACVFWSGPLDPETGLPMRLEAGEVAKRLELPEGRTTALLTRALASVPLVSESPGIAPPLEVLYEDEYLLAVHKPVGRHTAPIHRFTGGSVVNQVIAYLNRHRYANRPNHQHNDPALDPNSTPPATPAASAPPATSISQQQQPPPPPSAPSLTPFGYLPELLPPPPPFTIHSPSNNSSACSSSGNRGNSSSGSRGSSRSISSAVGGDIPAVAVTEPYGAGGDVTSQLGGDMSDVQSSTNEVPYQLEPYVLHRLDMNTSGVLLFAKRPEVVAGLHRQFRTRTLSKLYLAVAVGCPPAGITRFHLEAPIDRHPGQAVARVVADSGKEAATSFCVLSRNPHVRLGAHAGAAPGLLLQQVLATARPLSEPHNQQQNTSSADSSSGNSSCGSSPGNHDGGFLCVRLGGGDNNDNNKDGGSSSSSNSTTSSVSSSIAPATDQLPKVPEGQTTAATEKTETEAAATPSPPPVPPLPPGVCLVGCSPHSGRTHQIRVHLAALGHPLVGDDIYGVTGPWLPRQALHAAGLRFTHPITGLTTTITAPLPPDMVACLEALGLGVPDQAVHEAEWRALECCGGVGGSESAEGEGRGGSKRRGGGPRGRGARGESKQQQQRA